MDFIVLADHRIYVKDLKESVNIDKYLNLFGELKEVLNQEGDSHTNCYQSIEESSKNWRSLKELEASPDKKIVWILRSVVKY